MYVGGEGGIILVFKFLYKYFIFDNYFFNVFVIFVEYFRVFFILYVR